MLVSGLIHSCENLPCTNQLPVACGGKNRIPECVDKWSVAASKNEPEMTGVPFAVWVDFQGLIGAKYVDSGHVVELEYYGAWWMHLSHDREL